MINSINPPAAGRPGPEKKARVSAIAVEGVAEMRPAHPLASLAARRAVLVPHRLAATTEAAARALLRQGEATNTRVSYSSAMRYWCAWYAARYGQALALPVPVPVVVQFIVDHAARRPDGEGVEDASLSAGPADERSRAADSAAPDGSAPQRAAGKRLQKRHVLTDLVTEMPEDVDAALVAGGYKGKAGPPALATLVHRIAVLSKAHQMAQAGRMGHSSFEEALASSAAGRRRPEEGGSDLQGMAGTGGVGEARLLNPCADPLVRELLARTRRAHAQRGVRPRKQRALTKDPLRQLLATCDESPKGIRDRALLLFAWSTGGRRRSEVTSARIEHLQRVEEGAFIFTLGHSKTNQQGELRPEDVKPLVGSAAVAMQAWLTVLSKDGIKEGPIFRRIRRGGHLGEPLAAAAVRDIVRERCAAAGVGEGFSAHSLRAGFVTEAGRQSLPLAETMALTGHHSVASVLGYFRTGVGLSKIHLELGADPP